MTSAPAGEQPIAIIGSGCRFPGNVTSPSKLWDLLREPREVAEPITQDRFSSEGFYHPDSQYHGHFNVKDAYFLTGKGAHGLFDALSFRMNPAEAVSLDPQCRLLLETVYEALEDAGLTIETLRGSDTAVYTGQMVADYDQVVMRYSDSR
jgi:hybrid polyketide synthase / nonribosomal peptide synthetase ACE1